MIKAGVGWLGEEAVERHKHQKREQGEQEEMAL